MSRFGQGIYVLATLLLIFSCAEKGKYETKTEESNGYTYEYVTNDPLKARIYTLKNGLKVYLSS
jgi:zinc protease